jgi:RHS repeat-associated protein
MEMPGRSYEAGGYRFGFQAQEGDPELFEGALSFKYRIYDPRIGRFSSVDPLSANFPWNGTYNFSENRVINAVELEGLQVVSRYAAYSPRQPMPQNKSVITIKITPTPQAPNQAGLPPNGARELIVTHVHYYIQTNPEEGSIISINHNIGKAYHYGIAMIGNLHEWSSAYLTGGYSYQGAQLPSNPTQAELMKVMRIGFTDPVQAFKFRQMVDDYEKRYSELLQIGLLKIGDPPKLAEKPTTEQMHTFMIDNMNYQLKVGILKMQIRDMIGDHPADILKKLLIQSGELKTKITSERLPTITGR